MRERIVTSRRFHYAASFRPRQAASTIFLKSNLARLQLILIGGGDASKRFCLLREDQGDCDGHETHACHAQQAGRVAESLRNDSRY